MKNSNHFQVQSIIAFYDLERNDIEAQFKRDLSESYFYYPEYLKNSLRVVMKFRQAEKNKRENLQEEEEEADEENVEQENKKREVSDKQQSDVVFPFKPFERVVPQIRPPPYIVQYNDTVMTVLPIDAESMEPDACSFPDVDLME